MDFFERNGDLVASNDVYSLTGREAEERWNFEVSLGTPVVVSYSFPTQAAPYDNFSGAQNGFDGFSAAHAVHARTALDAWAATSGITFVEVPADAGGDITFGFLDMEGQFTDDGFSIAGFAYYPETYSQSRNGISEYVTFHDGIGGDIFLDRDDYFWRASTIAPGVDGYRVLQHEIGHALGLSHPFDEEPIIQPGHDNSGYTIMPYNRTRSETQLGTVDREAMELLYGAPLQSLEAVWDADTATMQITGTDEDDILLGSHLDDVLDGGAGNDILLADGGRNILLGGGENDRFVADTGTHLINGGAGASDKVLITDYYDLSALSGAQGRIVYDGFDAVVEMEDVEEIWFDTRIFGGSLTIRSTLDLFGAPTPKQNGAAANDVLTGTDARDWLGGAQRQ